MIYDKDERIKHLETDLQEKLYAIEGKDCQMRALSERVLQAETHQFDIRTECNNLQERY